jgi:uncharacterized membrane protein
VRIGGWTLKDIVQGKPWAHPTHPMFVHFPTALYPVALGFDIASRVRESPSYTATAVVLLGIGIIASVGAVITGLVDWWGMVRGSTKRRAATRHLLVQSASQLLVLSSFHFQLFAMDQPVAMTAIVLLAAGVLLLLAGNWFGGVLVYRMAMRVGGAREPSRPKR